MTHPLSWACALLLVFVFAVADRIVGGAGKRSAGMIVAVAGGGLLGYLAAGLPLAFVGVAWMIYRSLPFTNGSAAPTTGSQRAAAAIRHVPVFLAFPPIYWAHGENLKMLVICLAGAWAAAFILALWYGGALIKARSEGRPIGRENEAVELLRGAAFGAALAVYAIQ